VVVKLFEIRDKGTFMPVMAVRLVPTAQSANFDREHWLLRRAGYGDAQLMTEPGFLEPYVILAKLDGVEAQYDPFLWGAHRRTLRAAHLHIIEKWWELNSGDLIDVQFILGETPEPKKSEQGADGY